jgi:hypothetical protein
MARPMIEIQLTPEERALSLRYGYLFEQIEQALMTVSSSEHVETVSLDSYEVNQLIGDLCRSINHDHGATPDPDASRHQQVSLSSRFSAAAARPRLSKPSPCPARACANIHLSL